MKNSDRFLKIVEWSKRDGCFVGTCPGLALGGVHGPDERSVYAEICDVVDEWIRIHSEDKAPLPPPTAGKGYSGKFVLRVGEDLHKRLALQALRDGESLNSFCTRKLAGETRPKAKPGKRARRTG